MMPLFHLVETTRPVNQRGSKSVGVRGRESGCFNGGDYASVAVLGRSGRDRRRVVWRVGRQPAPPPLRLLRSPGLLTRDEFDLHLRSPRVRKVNRRWESGRAHRISGVPQSRDARFGAGYLSGRTGGQLRARRRPAGNRPQLLRSARHQRHLYLRLRRGRRTTTWYENDWTP